MIGFWSDLQNAERAMLKMERCPEHTRYRAERAPRAQCLVCRWLWAKAEEMRKGPTINGKLIKDLVKTLNGET